MQFTVAANISTARTGTITASGQTFTVVQESGCSAVVTPDTIPEPATGGFQTVAVSTAAECSWTAGSNAAWITIPPPTTGTGNGMVRLDIQANTGPARTGTATIAGKTVTVNQDSGCAVSLAPTAQLIPVTGGTGSIAVTAADGCAWTATSNNVEWLKITAGSAGSGAGTVSFSVDPNIGAARIGTITIGGQTFTVTQAGT